MDLVLQQLQREIGEGLSGLDATQTQLRPSDDATRWSIQQIVEHLLLTYASTCGVFEARIEKKTPTKARPTMRQRAAQWLVLGVGYFPSGVKAPVGVMPGVVEVALSGEELTERAREALERLDRLAVEAERLFGRGRSVSHGVLGPLHVMQWRRFHLVHGEHHLKQVRAIRRANGL